MQVILTHEQADFDAIAALLGAALLHPHASAVLPRRTNRNVRAFLSLYAPELPFIEPRDLNGEPIESVILVDTQSLVTIKGMSEATQVHVVDHHPLREDLSPRWTRVYAPLGAVTTLLVESLQEQAVPLNSLQASLLLLGIYEDTGSLSYVSTTPRDVRAAAHLLEAGASLRLVDEFLNPSLSPEQRRLYDHLLENARTRRVHGLQIVVAAAQAMDISEEISSIAHKLRDLLDPDGLILLVQTNEGIRLVARSTSDQVDVSRVAAHFGGGGHARAAAALIHADGEETTLDTVVQRLEDYLPKVVRPPLTVGQIMSRKPQLLTPETTVQQADELMRRYGYEGFPVISNGRVIGLLTRRAVDRALSHRLNLNAASLMDAGEITIQAHDSVHSLQQLMTSTGWGQIPVVDEEGRVTGIVTRTDLLNTLALPETRTHRPHHLEERLTAALPPARLDLLKRIAHHAQQQKVAVYVVGGFVRDLLLNRPSLDFDIVVEGDAISLARSLQASYGGRITSHRRFGTAKWQLDSEDQRLQGEGLPESLDLISARREFYEKPTGLPVVESGSIKLDLHRRDFTINTLALRLDGKRFGELYDYWGGLNDLEQGVVKVLHSISFIDDPTRMLRAVRFEQRFGFRIEARTLKLMEGAIDQFRQVSGDRLRHELDLILAEPRAVEMIARLQDLGLLAGIHPELTWKGGSRRAAVMRAALQDPPRSDWQLPESVGNMPLHQYLGYLVWLVPHSAGEEIAARLRLPHQLIDGLQAAQRIWDELSEVSELRTSQAVFRLENIPLPALYALRLLRSESAVRDLLDRYAAKLRWVQPVTTGDDLRARGLTPSPRYKDILQRLRSAWLDGEVSSAGEEMQLLERILASQDEPLYEQADTD